jgi:hypothetical protein
MGEKRNSYKSLVGKPERKIPLVKGYWWESQKKKHH